jgi:hypothetical protein
VTTNSPRQRRTTKAAATEREEEVVAYRLHYSSQIVNTGGTSSRHVLFMPARSIFSTPTLAKEPMTNGSVPVPDESLDVIIVTAVNAVSDHTGNVIGDVEVPRL